MKDLQNFYTNHYKKTDMPEWDQLNDKQKKLIENSGGFAAYNLHKAVEILREQCLKQLPTLIEAMQNINKSIGKLAKEYKKKSQPK